MLLSNDCWLKSTCNKYKKDDCECKFDNIFCIKLFKLETLFDLSLLPKSKWVRFPLRLDEDRKDEQVFTRLKYIETEIENFISQGNNLYLYSHITGNGKTEWSIRLLQAYLEKIWYKSDLVSKVLFINVPKYLLAIKDNISQYNEYANTVKENILTADLVIWDDIGTKSATSFEHENLFSVIDYRLIENKSNIYTSNLSPTELCEAVGDRLYSRIINYSIVLEFKGADKRSIKRIGDGYNSTVSDS